MNVPVALALHGGCGTLRREDFDDARRELYEGTLRSALQAGWVLLREGRSAREAVVEAVALLEDSPLFNAGRGSVLTHEGTVEMDAALMCGENLRAGAVAGLSYVRNPVRAAHAVLKDSRFVLLSGEGALAFCRETGLREEPPEFFITPERQSQLEKALQADAVRLDHDEKFGTVGAVALDRCGHLAAATSTGGLTNKRFGRIGDSPVIGAGTYADDRACAVSCTGYGEGFLRAVSAHEVAARMRFGGQSLESAAGAAIAEGLARVQGEGGLIAVDARGNIALPFNTEGMYRAWQRSGEEPSVAIFA